MSRSGWFWALFAAAGLLLLGAGWWHRLQEPAEAGGGSYEAVNPERALPRPAARAEDRRAAIATIAAQLDAFRTDDYERAIGYQSAGLRRNFESSEMFRRMMTTTYPQFAHSRTADYGDAWQEPDGRISVTVTVTGQDGVTVEAVYRLVREKDGYRVDGVSGGLGRLRRGGELI